MILRIPNAGGFFMWFILALLSAIFAGAVSVLVKPGLGEGATKISPNLATAIRMLVVLPLAWTVVFAEGSFSQMTRIVPRQWNFLLLSGLATGLSWLFYFFALAKADATSVAPVDKSSMLFTFLFAMIFLGETLTWQKTVAGILVLAALVVTLIK